VGKRRFREGMMGWMDESLDVIKVVCQSAGGIHEARYDPANQLSALVHVCLQYEYCPSLRSRPT
jgi:hypothetical protein